MINVVVIRIPSVTFPPEVVADRRIYRGLDEWVMQRAERLRDKLHTIGVPCTPVSQNHKVGGSEFIANAPSARYLVLVAPETTALPSVEIHIIAQEAQFGFWANVFRGRGRMPSAADWDLFEPSFRAAAEAEFSDGQLRWVSMDEYEKVPSRA